MSIPPAFWQTDGLIARALSPLETITRVATARRVARLPAFRAPIPVICCGNASVGGTGKTPLCLDIAGRLRARGVDAHILTRGYGGAARGITRVDPSRDTAAIVGDEAMLLALSAPTWVGADRAAAARAALAAGAGALVMDDGLQNPSLEKTCAILVADGASGFGNHRLLPAGPLREPVVAAAARCQAAVIIGADATDAAASLGALPIFTARLAPDASMRGFAGRQVVAFAGIGRPAKFFATLREAGITPAAEISFADHHVYRPHELARLQRQAVNLGLPLVTTTKDYARLPAAARPGIQALGATLVWDNPEAWQAFLRAAVPASAAAPPGV